MMKILLGQEGDRHTHNKISWIKHVFEEETYEITAHGFIYNDYYVTFSNKKYETLYNLKYPQ